MRAVGLFTHGGPEVLQVVELPEVHAGPGQVRIHVHGSDGQSNRRRGPQRRARCTAEG
jgi:hypothetical protein